MSRAAPEGDPLPPLEGVLGLVRLLGSVEQGLRRMSRRTEEDLGVTAQQRLFLRLVGRFPGVTAGQLARTARVHPSTVTATLARLESRGLVHREIDSNDRRRAFVALTAAGRRIDAMAEGTFESALRGALRGLPEEKVEVTREVLAALAGALQAEGHGETGRQVESPAGGSGPTVVTR